MCCAWAKPNWIRWSPGNQLQQWWPSWRPAGRTAMQEAELKPSWSVLPHPKHNTFLVFQVFPAHSFKNTCFYKVFLVFQVSNSFQQPYARSGVCKKHGKPGKPCKNKHFQRFDMEIFGIPGIAGMCTCARPQVPMWPVHVRTSTCAYVTSLRFHIPGFQNISRS